MFDKSKKDIIEKPKDEIIQRKRMDILDDIDSLFDGFRENFDRAFLNPIMMTRRPPMDVIDLGDKYEMTIEAPGVPKESINIEVTSNTIEVSGEHEEATDEKGKDWLRQERGKVSFYRCVEFPEEIKSDDVNAQMDKGVLTILIPKSEPKPKIESKKIEIK